MLKKALYVLVGIILLSLIVSYCNGKSEGSSPADSTTTTTTSPSTSPAQEEKSNYTYSEQTDEMTDAKIKFASITSDNTFELEFPYGECSLTYTIRKNAKGNNDVYLHISSGQFMGNQITGDNYITVRFDDLPASKYSFSNSSDGSSDYIFLNNTKDFIAKAKQAKEIKIEVTLFNEGNKLFRFSSPQPLVWE